MDNIHGTGELFLAFSPTMMSGLSGLSVRPEVHYVRRCRDAGLQIALLTINVAEWRGVWQQIFETLCRL